jgi:hypothetical protein
MEDSDVSIYSFVSANKAGVTLNILNSNAYLPQGISYLQLTNTFLNYGTYNTVNGFTSNGNSYPGSWTAFCPAFYIYSRSGSPKVAYAG